MSVGGYSEDVDFTFSDVEGGWEGEGNTNLYVSEIGKIVKALFDRLGAGVYISSAQGADEVVCMSARRARNMIFHYELGDWYTPSGAGRVPVILKPMSNCSESISMWDGNLYSLALVEKLGFAYYVCDMDENEIVDITSKTDDISLMCELDGATFCTDMLGQRVCLAEASETNSALDERTIDWIHRATRAFASICISFDSPSCVYWPESYCREFMLNALDIARETAARISTCKELSDDFSTLEQAINRFAGSSFFDDTIPCVCSNRVEWTDGMMERDMTLTDLSNAINDISWAVSEGD